MRAASSGSSESEVSPARRVRLRPLYATKGKGGGSFHEVETLNVYVFGVSFDYNDYGIASTILILFFLIIIASMWILTFRRKERQS